MLPELNGVTETNRDALIYRCRRIIVKFSSIIPGDPIFVQIEISPRSWDQVR